MVILIVSILIGLLLFGIGFTLTEKNASSILSGYNTMSITERKHVKLNAYISFFRIFHVIIGSSIIVLSLVFYNLNLVDFIGFTLIFFCLPGYTFFIFRSQYYFPPQSKGIYNLSALIMFIISIGVIILLLYTQMNPKVEFIDKELRISGVYGENIKIKDIEDVKLLENPPLIKLKLNGIAMAKIKKGWFKLQDGRKVKLFINDPSGPYVQIKTIDKKIIIIGIKEFDDSLLYQYLIRLKKKSSDLSELYLFQCK